VRPVASGSEDHIPAEPISSCLPILTNMT